MVTPDKLRPSVVVTVTLAAVLALACPLTSRSFTTELRLVAASSGPLIESLSVSPELKTGLITDFADLANDTATVGDCIHDAADKPAKLICVETFEGQAEVIINRGHFRQANSPKLQRVLTLIRGIIASTRIYYGGAPSTPITAAAVSRESVTEASIKAQIKELKEAMKP